MGRDGERCGEKGKSVAMTCWERSGEEKSELRSTQRGEVRGEDEWREAKRNGER